MNARRARLAVFLSGRGSGFQNLFMATESGKLFAEIVWVVSNNADAGGLKLAVGDGLDTFVYSLDNYASKTEAANDLLKRLREHAVEFIMLAGYMKLLPAEAVTAYRSRIVNIHPALLPKYGGKGMFGRHVHEAVIKAGDKESGATVHLVDERYDNGKILEQVRVPVYEDDSAETLAARVLIEEHRIYPVAIEKLITGKYDASNG